jgi:hypothetical protein
MPSTTEPATKAAKPERRIRAHHYDANGTFISGLCLRKNHGQCFSAKCCCPCHRAVGH